MASDGSSVKPCSVAKPRWERRQYRLLRRGFEVFGSIKGVHVEVDERGKGVIASLSQFGSSPGQVPGSLSEIGVDRVIERWRKGHAFV